MNKSFLYIWLLMGGITLTACEQEDNIIATLQPTTP